MNNTLVNAIKASIIHKKIGKEIREIIKPGMTLKQIVLLIEDKIKTYTNFDINEQLKAGIAFPVGVSVNNCAAHYTPNYNEEDIILKYDDIIKIDYGVHINGTIIDSAFTLHFNDKFDEFINISKDLTNFAVSKCGPDVILGEIGEDIEEYVKSIEITIDDKKYNIKTMHELSGHNISLYNIHAGKAVPNTSIKYDKRMNEFEYFAIEPFITTGEGYSIFKNPDSHYMLSNINGNNNILKKDEKHVLNIINKNYSSLPFCQRWLYELDKNVDYNHILNNLSIKKYINKYPPIYDIDNSYISQFEHTIFIKNNGIINLTKNEFF